MKVPGQIGLFEFLEENYGFVPEDKVRIEGVINIDTFSDFTVQSTYRDIFLIVNMLDDYVSMLEAQPDTGFYTNYMTDQFKRISKELSEQIQLDKEKMYKNFHRKRMETDDVGEDAMILMAKKR